MKTSTLSAWLDIAGDTLAQFDWHVDWSAAGQLLAELLNAPVAGHLTWAPMTDAAVTAWEQTVDEDLPSIAAQAPYLHPLARHYTRTRSDSILAIDDVAPLTSASACGYRELLREHEMDQHLWIPLGPEDGTLAICGACRSSDAFTAQERADAATVQGLLVGIAAHAATARRWAIRLGDLSAAQARAREVEGHLTAREVLVLDLCALGMTTVAIGRSLAVSPRTVEKHLENTYRKLGVRDRVSAVQRAQTCGFIGSRTQEWKTESRSGPQAG